MNLLMDPNLIVLLLMFGFVLAILALFTPGTGILEIGALFLIVLAGYGLVSHSVNLWALGLFIIGLVLLVLAIRRGRNWYLFGLSLLTVTAGLLFIIRPADGAAGVSPLMAIPLGVLSTGFLWVIGRVGLKALRLRPSQDLSRLLEETGEARTDIGLDGTVYVGGEEWTARSKTPIRAGSLVRVTGRDGLVLEVEPIIPESR